MECVPTAFSPSAGCTLPRSRLLAEALRLRQQPRSAHPSTPLRGPQTYCDTASSPRESRSTCDRSADTDNVLPPPTLLLPPHDGAGKCRDDGTSGTHRRSDMPSPGTDAARSQAKLHTFASPQAYPLPVPVHTTQRAARAAGRLRSRLLAYGSKPSAPPACGPGPFTLRSNPDSNFTRLS